MARRIPLIALLLVAACGVVPGSAGAAGTTTTPPTTTPPPAPVPVPVAQPKPARVSLTLAGSFRVGGRQLTVAGKRVRIDGRIVPFVPGQQVSVRIWRGHKLIKRVTVRPRPTRTGQTATFHVRFISDHSGVVQVFAVHEQTAEQAKVVAHAARLSVVAPRAGPGTRSPFVALLQQRLAALGFSVSRSGAYDAQTQRAVLAYRKVGRLPRVTSLSPLVVDRLLRGVGSFHVRYPRQGRHVEANLGQQVLALIDRGRVLRTYLTSSGKPSTPTVLGTFHFYSKTPGTNSHGMVNSSYFIRGYAIHGYAEVPTYNASHGCLRVPIPDALAIYSWVHIGDPIDVYY